MQKNKIYKFVFNALIHHVTLALKFPCFVSITWKRGQKIAEVKERKEIEKGVVNFNQNLELECNMNFDSTSRKFEEKKTKFTVLIFSDRGNKQAGEVSFDVSQFLNLKQKEMKVEKSLDKCPDKNAKISFTLTSYIKEEIKQDEVSHKSDKEQDSDMSMMNQSAIQRPDFKKKKPDILRPPKMKRNETQQQQKSPSPKKQNLPVVNKANIGKIKLQQENRKLKEQLNELQELQIENSALKRRFEEAEKKSFSYYSKKLEESKREFNDLKVKSKMVEDLIQKKLQLEKEMCHCKEQMGRILNFAITSGNNEMTEQIYSIYQAAKN